MHHSITHIYFNSKDSNSRFSSLRYLRKISGSDFGYMSHDQFRESGAENAAGFLDQSRHSTGIDIFFRHGIMQLHTVILHATGLSCALTFIVSFTVSTLNGTLTYPAIYLSNSINQNPGSMIGGFGLSLTAFFMLVSGLVRHFIIEYLCDDYQTDLFESRNPSHPPNDEERLDPQLTNTANISLDINPSSERRASLIGDMEVVRARNRRTSKVIFLVVIALVGVGACQIHNGLPAHMLFAGLFFGSVVYYTILQTQIDQRLVRLNLLKISPRMILFRKLTAFGAVACLVGVGILSQIPYHFPAALCECMLGVLLMTFFPCQHTLFESYEIGVVVRKRHRVDTGNLEAGGGWVGGSSEKWVLTKQS